MPIKDRDERKYDSSSNTWVGNGVTSFSSDGSQSDGIAARSGLYGFGMVASAIGWVPKATLLVGLPRGAGVYDVSDLPRGGSGPGANAAGASPSAGPGASAVVKAPTSAAGVPAAAGSVPTAGAGLPAAAAAGPRRPSTGPGQGAISIGVGGPRLPQTWEAANPPSNIPRMDQVISDFSQVEDRPFPVGPLPMTMSSAYPTGDTIENDWGESDVWNPIAGVIQTGVNIMQIGHNIDRAAQEAIRVANKNGFGPNTPVIGGTWISENVSGAVKSVGDWAATGGYSERFKEIPGGF